MKNKSEYLLTTFITKEIVKMKNFIYLSVFIFLTGLYFSGCEFGVPMKILHQKFLMLQYQDR